MFSVTTLQSYCSLIGVLPVRVRMGADRRAGGGLAERPEGGLPCRMKILHTALVALIIACDNRVFVLPPTPGVAL